MPSVSLHHGFSPSSLLTFFFSFRKDVKKTPPQLTAASIATLGSQSRTQLDGWRTTAERHEQIVLGQKASGSKAKTEKWLDEIDKKISGNGK